MRGLPQLGQDVYVVAPSGATIDARVRDVDAVSTLLALEGRASASIGSLAGGQVAIEYTNRRGVCRIAGSAHQEPETGVLRVDHTGKVVLIQRREFVRVDAMVRVTHRPLGESGWTAETTTVNLSGGGFMVSGRAGLRFNAATEFVVELDGETRDAGPLETTGRVVRETPQGLGVLIERIDGRERERLIRWIFARERLSRQIVGK